MEEIVEDRNEKQEEEEEPQNQKGMEKEGVIGKYSDETYRARKSFVWRTKDESTRPGIPQL